LFHLFHAVCRKQDCPTLVAQAPDQFAQISGVLTWTSCRSGNASAFGVAISQPRWWKTSALGIEKARKWNGNFPAPFSHWAGSNSASVI
jgi:hypothetical protein